MFVFNPQVMHNFSEIIDLYKSTLHCTEYLKNYIILSKCQFLISNSKQPHIWIKRIWTFTILWARFLVFYNISFWAFHLCTTNTFFHEILLFFMEYSINTIAYVLYFIWFFFQIFSVIFFSQFPLLNTFFQFVFESWVFWKI